MKKNIKKAFTLLELAIVLTIVAILAIPAVDFLILSSKSTKIQDTRNKSSFVTEAISSYYKSYGKLPLPARIDLSSEDEEYTKSGDDNEIKTSSGKYYYGSLPTEELGISDKYMFDKWGNKFSYYVTKNATKDETAINKHNENTLYAKDNDIGTKASSGHIFAIISHGESGEGAYNAKGEQKKISSSIEISNIFNSSDIGTELNPLILSDGSNGEIATSSKRNDVLANLFGRTASGRVYAGNQNVTIGGSLVSDSNSTLKIDLDGDSKLSNVEIEGEANINNLVVKRTDIPFVENNASNGIVASFERVGEGDVGLSFSQDSINSFAIIHNSGKGTASDNQAGGLNFYGGRDRNTAGALLMRLSDNGNLGIGNDNPTERLHVSGDARVTDDMIVSGNVGIGDDAPTEALTIIGNIRITGSYLGSSGDPITTSATLPSNASIEKVTRLGSALNNGILLGLVRDGDENGGEVGISFVQRNIVPVVNEETNSFAIIHNAGKGSASDHQAGGLDFYQGRSDSNVGTLLMRLSDLGRLGIGTDNPSETLDVRGTNEQNILISGGEDNNAGVKLLEKVTSGSEDGAIIRYNGANDRLDVNSIISGTEQINLTVLNSGNVGVGTVIPDSKLHIMGDIKVTGDYLDASGNLAIATLPEDGIFGTGLTIGSTPNNTRITGGNIITSGDITSTAGNIIASAIQTSSLTTDSTILGRVAIGTSNYPSDVVIAFLENISRKLYIDGSIQISGHYLDRNGNPITEASTLPANLIGEDLKIFTNLTATNDGVVASFTNTNTSDKDIGISLRQGTSSSFAIIHDHLGGLSFYKGNGTNIQKGSDGTRVMSLSNIGDLSINGSLTTTGAVSFGAITGTSLDAGSGLITTSGNLQTTGGILDVDGTGNSTIAGDLRIGSSSSVPATIISVTNSVDTTANPAKLFIDGNMQISGKYYDQDGVEIGGSATLAADETITTSLTVGTDSKLTGTTLGIGKTVGAGIELDVEGDIAGSGNLSVTGDSKIGGKLTASGANLDFFTNDTATERMRIDTSGNVGIGTGTNALTDRLEVSGNTSITGTTGDQLSLENITDSALVNINFEGKDASSVTQTGIITYDPVGNDFSINRALDLGANNIVTTGTAGFGAITGTSLDAGSGAITTSGDIATTGTGTITSAGAITGTSLDGGAGGLTTSGDIVTTGTTGELTIGGTGSSTIAGSVGVGTSDNYADFRTNASITGTTPSDTKLYVAGDMQISGKYYDLGGNEVGAIDFTSLTTNISTTGNIATTGTGTITSAGAITGTSLDGGTGGLTTSGNIATTGTGTITSAGAITGTSLDGGTGAITTTGAVSFGAITGASLNTGSGAITTSGNIATTGTGTITSAGAITGTSLDGGTGGLTTSGNIATTGTGTITSAGAITGTSLDGGTGGLTTSGNIATTGTGTITSAGAITGTSLDGGSGAITTTGAVSFGAITGTSLNTGSGAITTSGNIATTGTGTITSAGAITGTSLDGGAGGLTTSGDIVTTGTTGELTIGGTGSSTIAGSVGVGTSDNYTDFRTNASITGTTPSDTKLYVVGDMQISGKYYDLGGNEVGAIDFTSLTTNISTTGNIATTGTGTITSAGAITGTSLDGGTGGLTTSGNIATTGTGTITSAGAITGTSLDGGSGAITTTGAVSFGAITGTSLNTGSGAITTSGNIATTGTGTITSAGAITGTSLDGGAGGLTTSGDIVTTGTTGELTIGGTGSSTIAGSVGVGTNDNYTDFRTNASITGTTPSDTKLYVAGDMQISGKYYDLGGNEVGAIDFTSLTTNISTTGNIATTGTGTITSAGAITGTSLDGGTGGLTTSGNIATTGTGTITSAGAITGTSLEVSGNIKSRVENSTTNEIVGMTITNDPTDTLSSSPNLSIEFDGKISADAGVTDTSQSIGKITYHSSSGNGNFIMNKDLIIMSSTSPVFTIKNTLFNSGVAMIFEGENGSSGQITYNTVNNEFAFNKAIVVPAGNSTIAGDLRIGSNSSVPATIISVTNSLDTTANPPKLFIDGNMQISGKYYDQDGVEVGASANLAADETITTSLTVGTDSKLTGTTLGIGKTVGAGIELDVEGDIAGSGDLRVTGDSKIGGKLTASGANLDFFTNDTATERMRIDTSGNVGIGTGTNALTDRLEVSGNTSITGTTGDQLSLENITDSALVNINFEGKDASSVTQTGKIEYDPVGNDFSINRALDLGANNIVTTGTAGFGAITGTSLDAGSGLITTSGNLQTTGGILDVDGTGNSTIAGDLRIGSSSSVPATIISVTNSVDTTANSPKLFIDGNMQISGKYYDQDGVEIGGSATLAADETITTSLTVGTDSKLTGTTLGIGKTVGAGIELDVEGDIAGSGDLSVTGDSKIGGKLTASGANLDFFTNDTATERMRIDTSGNVGIGTGTNALTDRLEVSGNTSITGTTGDQLSLENITDSALVNINFEGKDASSVTQTGKIEYDPVGNDFSINRSLNLGANNIVTTGTAGFGAITGTSLDAGSGLITTSGNLQTTGGILDVDGTGNSTIAGDLRIGSSSSVPATIISVTNSLDTTANPAKLFIDGNMQISGKYYNQDGAEIGISTTLAADETIVTSLTVGTDSKLTGTTLGIGKTVGAGIELDVEGDIAGSGDLSVTGDSKIGGKLTASGANLDFFTNDTATERMRIDTSGNVGIGTGTNALTDRLEVDGNIKVDGNIEIKGFEIDSSVNHRLRFNYNNSNIFTISNSVAVTPYFFIANDNVPINDTDNYKVTIDMSAKFTTVGIIREGSIEFSGLNNDFNINRNLNIDGNISITGTTGDQLSLENTTDSALVNINFEGKDASSITQTGKIEYDPVGNDFTLTNNTNVTDDFVATGGVTGGSAYVNSSDKRIKDIKGISDSKQDLSIIKKLKITDYLRKDKIQYGNKKEKMLIAQQLEKHYPQAVSTRKNIIPDIYKKAKSFKLLVNNKVEITGAKFYGLKKGEKVKILIGELKKNQKSVKEEITSVSGKKFVIKLSDSNYKKIEKAKSLFIYGREVKDFKSVAYSEVAMLNVSATQELAKRQENMASKQEKIIEKLSKITGEDIVLEEKDFNEDVNKKIDNKDSIIIKQLFALNAILMIIIFTLSIMLFRRRYKK